MHSMVLYDHGKVISVDDTVEYLHGAVLQSNNIYIHQQLSKFSETTDLSGMVWNGLEWSEVSEMSEMSKMSNSLDT